MPYFNWVTVPISLALILLMGAGPLVPWRRGSWEHLGRLLRFPAALALAGSLVLWLLGRVPFGLVALGYMLPLFVAAAVLLEGGRAAPGPRPAPREGPPAAP